MYSWKESNLDIMQFASAMYFLLVSPSGNSLDLQEVYTLRPIHDEHTVAKMLAKASSLEQRTICIAILSCCGKYYHVYVISNLLYI